MGGTCWGTGTNRGSEDPCVWCVFGGHEGGVLGRPGWGGFFPLTWSRGMLFLLCSLLGDTLVQWSTNLSPRPKKRARERECSFICCSPVIYMVLSLALSLAFWKLLKQKPQYPFIFFCPPCCTSLLCITKLFSPRLWVTKPLKKVLSGPLFLSINMSAFMFIFSIFSCHE